MATGPITICPPWYVATPGPWTFSSQCIPMYTVQPGKYGHTSWILIYRCRMRMCLFRFITDARHVCKTGDGIRHTPLGSQLVSILFNASKFQNCKCYATLFFSRKTFFLFCGRLVSSPALPMQVTCISVLALHIIYGKAVVFHSDHKAEQMTEKIQWSMCCLLGRSNQLCHEYRKQNTTGHGCVSDCQQNISTLLFHAHAF